MEKDLPIPRRIPSSTCSRLAGAFALAAGVFLSLCLVASPVNLPAQSAIAAVAIDDVPGDVQQTAGTVARDRLRAVRAQALRSSRRLGRSPQRASSLVRRWVHRRAGWSTSSGVPPPPRRGPPLFT